MSGYGEQTSESENKKFFRERRRRVQGRFAHLIYPRVLRSLVQPQPQFRDGGGGALREDLDGAVRQIADDAPDGQPLGLEPCAVPEVHALNLPEDEKTTNDLAH